MAVGLRFPGVARESLSGRARRRLQAQEGAAPGTREHEPGATMLEAEEGPGGSLPDGVHRSALPQDGGGPRNCGGGKECPSGVHLHHEVRRLVARAGEKAMSCGGGGASEIPELTVIRELHLRTIDELGLDKSIVSVFSPLSLNNNSWWMGSIGGVVATLSRKRSVDVRRINPKVPKEEVVTISGRLVQILSDHGPLTIDNTWNNTQGTENGITFFVMYEFRYPINQSGRVAKAGERCRRRSSNNGGMRRKHAKSIKSKFNDLMSTHPPLNEAYSDVCVFSLRSPICYIDLPNLPAELKKLKHKKCLVQSPNSFMDVKCQQCFS
ncbi:hypothetical protein ACJX0J_042420, partial [Zea mays]